MALFVILDWYFYFVMKITCLQEYEVVSKLILLIFFQFKAQAWGFY